MDGVFCKLIFLHLLDYILDCYLSLVTDWFVQTHLDLTDIFSLLFPFSSLLLLVDRLGRKLFLVLMASFSLVVYCSDVTFLHIYLRCIYKYISIFINLTVGLFVPQTVHVTYFWARWTKDKIILFVFLACTFGFWQLFLTALTRWESRSESKEQFPICSQCFYKRQACGEVLNNRFPCTH